MQDTLTGSAAAGQPGAPDFTPQRLSSARWAVSAAFFANGFVVGHWAPKIAVMVERLGISESILGRMIILFGVGAIIALVIGAVLVTRLGSARVVKWTSLMLAPALLLITVTPDVFSTALAMLWLGMFLGAMDNAMNANGVGVEVRLARPVMSSYHGFWSLGGVVGGLTGGALIAWLGELGHALLVMVVVLMIVAYAWPRYIDADPDGPQAEAKPKGNLLSRLPQSPGIYILATVTLACFASEGTVIDWSALYLKDELQAPLVVSGYAFAAFSATMAAVRLSGDRLRSGIGDRTMFVAGSIVAAAGLGIAGLADTFLLACAGFFISGLGMANLVPVLFSAAGRYPGIKPSVGIAVITVFGYGGLLFIPALVGGIAERWSLSVIFIGWAVLLLAIPLVGSLLPGMQKADQSADSGSADKAA